MSKVRHSLDIKYLHTMTVIMTQRFHEKSFCWFTCEQQRNVKLPFPVLKLRKNGVHIKVTALRKPLHRCTTLLLLKVYHIFLSTVETIYLKELRTAKVRLKFLWAQHGFLLLCLILFGSEFLKKIKCGRRGPCWAQQGFDLILRVIH